MERLALNQYVYLVILFLVGGSIIVDIGDYGADLWIVYGVGSFLGIMLFAICYRNVKLHGFRPLTGIFPGLLRHFLGQGHHRGLPSVFSLSHPDDWGTPDRHDQRPPHAGGIRPVDCIRHAGRFPLRLT